MSTPPALRLQDAYTPTSKWEKIAGVGEGHVLHMPSNSELPAVPDPQERKSYRSSALPLVACVALLLAGCGESENAGSKSGTAAPAIPESTAEGPRTPALAAVIPEQPRDIVVIVRDVVLVPPSSKERPLARINFLTHAGDGSGRLFVNDLNGRIFVIRHEKLLPEPLLDMAVARRGSFTSEEHFEQGLAGFAFHPDFAKPGRPGFGKLYTSSTEVPGSGKPDFPTPDPHGRVSHHDVLTEWTIDPKDPNRVDIASRREVLRIAHPLHDHVMCQLGFAPHARPSDPDYGMLYVGIGDGGNTVFQYKKVDAMQNAQNRLRPLGKILRIDPLRNGDRKYSIPPDNPFVNDASSLKEIWAYGLRNPQRFSWDIEGDHKMLIADIGQAQAEEIDVGRPGANYGWGEREGTFVVDPDDENHVSSLPSGDERFGYTYPAIEYRHDLGKAITGGFVYRGRAIAPLRASTCSATLSPAASSTRKRPPWSTDDSRRLRKSGFATSGVSDPCWRFSAATRGRICDSGWTSAARSTSSPSATA